MKVTFPYKTLILIRLVQCLSYIWDQIIKLLVKVTFPYKTLILIRLVQCLSYIWDQIIKLLVKVTFPYKTLILIRLVQCLSYIWDQKFVTLLVQSAITCTQEWNVVQYLVNKTNIWIHSRMKVFLVS